MATLQLCSSSSINGERCDRGTLCLTERLPSADVHDGMEIRETKHRAQKRDCDWLAWTWIEFCNLCSLTDCLSMCVSLQINVPVTVGSKWIARKCWQGKRGWRCVMLPVDAAQSSPRFACACASSQLPWLRCRRWKSISTRSNDSGWSKEREEKREGKRESLNLKSDQVVTDTQSQSNWGNRQTHKLNASDSQFWRLWGIY